MELAKLIVDLAWILIIAGITTLICKKLKQPVIIGYVLAGFLLSPVTDFFPMFVGSMEEIEHLVELGWQYEGVAWNSAPANHPEAIPLYRLYNPNADCGSHHYTGSVEEREFLVSLGWIFEGIGWFGLLK